MISKRIDSVCADFALSFTPFDHNAGLGLVLKANNVESKLVDFYPRSLISVKLYSLL